MKILVNGYAVTEYMELKKENNEIKDLNRAIEELEIEGIKPSQGYKEYILAIDEYVKRRFEYYIEFL